MVTEKSFLTYGWKTDALKSFSYPWCFPSSSAGKESACNVGDSGLISGLARSAGERIGYPLQNSRLPWWFS